MNIFEQATRQGIRFSSSVGDLTTEDLWKLPLLASRKGAVCLNDVAQSVDAELTVQTSKNFVQEVRNPKVDLLNLKMDVVKHIIADKLAEKAKRTEDAKKATERQTLKEALEKRNQADLESLSKEELEKRLAELDKQ